MARFLYQVLTKPVPRTEVARLLDTYCSKLKKT
jgi:hypothetical protein